MSECVVVDNLRSKSALTEILAALSIANTTGVSLRIDLSPLDRKGAEHRRLDSIVVALVANALIGRYADVPLHVVWPTSSVDGQLRRHGLLFALAVRRGQVTFADSPVAVADNCPDGLDLWRTPWRPRQETLLPELTPEQVDNRTFLYVDAHRVGRGHFRSYPENAAMPWLSNLIPTPRAPGMKDARDRFVTLSERAIVEVLENEPYHAFDVKGAVQDREEWLRPPEVDGRSFLLCSLTHGGADSWDRLRILAMDNGFGIGRTMRWQHPALKESVAELIEKILQRQLHQRNIPGHNGIGLWWLYDLVATFGGEVSIITEDDFDPTGTTAVGVQVSKPIQPPSETEEGLQLRRMDLPRCPIRGTLIEATLHVPRLTGDNWRRPLVRRTPVGAGR